MRGPVRRRPTVLTRVSALVVAAIALCVFRADSAARRAPRPAPGTPRPAAAVNGVYRYSLTARVNCLIFHITRPDVGSARVIRTLSADDARDYELLIGSDPERAPMRINRWGYIAETVRRGSARIVGVMTESDEQTAEAARASVQQAGGRHPFKAIRATVANGEAVADVLRVTFADNFTFRDLNSVLSRLPAEGRAKAPLRVPDGTSPGFLTALDDLLHASVEAWNAGGRVVEGASRKFVWDRGLYELTLRRSNRLDTLTAGPRTYRNCLKGKFEIRNLTTGNRTGFELTYGTRDDIAEVPVRIVYGPRWWFEVELTLANGS